MAKGPELLLKPTHGLIEERRGFLRESAALPVQLRAQPAKRASSARKLLPVPMNGVHKIKQPLLRRTQAVPLRPGCAKLLEAPLHHGFGEFFLGFEVVVDIAYRHASRLGDVRQTRLSETATIRQLRRSLNQPRSLVRLCRSHILRFEVVSYVTNSYHKPDAPVLSIPVTQAGVGGSTPSLATIIPKDLARAGDYSRSALSPHSRISKNAVLQLNDGQRLRANRIFFSPLSVRFGPRRGSESQLAFLPLRPCDPG